MGFAAFTAWAAWEVKVAISIVCVVVSLLGVLLPNVLFGSSRQAQGAQDHKYGLGLSIGNMFSAGGARMLTIACIGISRCISHCIQFHLSLVTL